MWLGLATRVWAIAALGRAFRTTVEVDPGQAVVCTGPYRWVRHPSYSGLSLIVIGCGLASGSWLALAVCAGLPLTALQRRIHVEEAELVSVLGDRKVRRASLLASSVAAASRALRCAVISSSVTTTCDSTQ